MKITKLLPKLIPFFSVPLLIFLATCNDHEEPANTGISKEDSAKMLVDRGEYLAQHVTGCIDCHSQRDFSQFSGPVVAGTEGMGGFLFNPEIGIPGMIHARNITPDTATGIGKWTDEELTRAITLGISAKGDTLFPVMPYPHFNSLSPEDVKSIIAYLHTLKPINNKIPDRQLFVPISMAYPPPVNKSIDNNIKPDFTDMVKYGEYVVNSAACMDCHTPMHKGQFDMSKYLGGSMTFNMGTFKVTSANITPDSATGIGKWTEEMFVSRFQLYKDPATFKTNPGKINTVMPWVQFSGMDEFDIKAIYRYLQTVPPVNNLVTKYPQ